MEADDFGTYVVKFRGAGQGLKVLVAEVVVGELGRRLGLRVPELRAVQLDAAIGRYEADEEVQDLLTASVGLNLAVDFLPGSFGWDAGFAVPEQEALRVLWLDAFTANVDRSWRNPNLLIWHRELWLIDHGAALYFHHSWQSGLDPERFAAQPLRRYRARLRQLCQRDCRWSMKSLPALIDENLLAEILEAVPDEWLEPAGAVTEPDSHPAGLRRLPAGSAGQPDGLAAGLHRSRAMTKSPFQYVVLRCVPRVDREEFVNVGVVLYSQPADYLACASHVEEQRLLAVAPELDIERGPVGVGRRCRGLRRQWAERVHRTGTALRLDRRAQEHHPAARSDPRRPGRGSRDRAGAPAGQIGALTDPVRQNPSPMSSSLVSCSFNSSSSTMCTAASSAEEA